MQHTLTITVDDSVYETLKPFVERQTISTFLAEVIGKGSIPKKSNSNIAEMRGTLHRVDTSNIREEDDRDL